MYSVLLLIASFGALSALYIQLDAPFVAVAQIIIYAGAIITPGVTVGECSIVREGAVVTENVPPYTVVAGAPARVVEQLPRDKARL